MVYANIIHIKRLLCYQASFFSGFGRHMGYDWRATASALSPRGNAFSFVDFWGFSSRNPGVTRIARTTECVRYKLQRAATSLLASRSILIDSSFPYLLSLEDQFSATEDAVVHLDTFWMSAT